jgi:signal transduction histidine kinase
VVLTVRDNGIGMSEEVLKEIFIPFFTTKDVNEGTGLGLPVVHGIVTSHGGVIRVDSAPGRGARFDVDLPLTAGEAGREVRTDDTAE